MDNEINEDEIFEKQESKFKNFKYKKAVIAIIVIVILAVVMFLAGIFGKMMNLFSMNETGNTAGNIMNFGYSVQNGDYIYYSAPSEDMNKTNIYRVKQNSNESEVIYEGDYDIRSLNIVGNKLYFISLSLEDVSENDEIDNKICKMNLDGSNFTVINDNEFAYDSYNMHIVKNNIYYIGEDKNVYKMDLDGGNRRLVAKTGTGYLTMNDKYIIYNKDNEDESDYITYIRELKGSEEREINSSRIFTPIIEGDYIYYINESNNFVKSPVTGGEEDTIVNFAIYNMNIYNGNIYYLNYKDEENEDYTVCIFKLNLDGGEPELVKELSSYSTFLNIVSDYAYYMDMDEEKAFLNLVNINDLSEIKLKEWKY